MRLRSLVAIALVVPSASFAQGGGAPPSGERPDKAVPLSPQPEIVARANDMSRSRIDRALGVPRSRLSIETYPLISRVMEPALSNGRPAESFSTVGLGTQLDYRFVPVLSVTAAVTSSNSGGSADAQTAELGLRLHPENLDARLRPFADVRLGFQRSSDEPAGPQADVGFGTTYGLMNAARDSRGFGAIAGTGAEYSLTSSFALMTGVSAMRSNMKTYAYTGTSLPTTSERFQMTTYRIVLGIRYNPVYRRSDDGQ